MYSIPTIPSIWNGSLRTRMVSSQSLFKRPVDLVVESAINENSMLRAAVERKFEIIGEALSKLAKVDIDDSFQDRRARENHRISKSSSTDSRKLKTGSSSARIPTQGDESAGCSRAGRLEPE